MKILAAGGGSGGHVTPVVAVLKELTDIAPDLEVTFVCDRAFEEQARGLMSRANMSVAVRIISAGKFRRYSHLTFWQHFTVPSVVWGNIRDTGRIAVGFVQSVGIMLRNRPDVLFAKGGYVCLPLGLAAWCLRVPVVIHDSDTRPGLTNKVLSRFAAVIATGSPLENYTYDAKKSHYIGVPIGKGFTPVSESHQKVLKEKLGFTSTDALIVVTGGGLGAVSINTAIARVAPLLVKKGISIYHITGKGHYDDLVSANRGYEDHYKIVPFVFEKMYEVLGAADVVVARGSATFIQELAGLEKAVVMVPARTLGDQLKNAKMYGAAQAVEVVADSDSLGEDDTFTDLLVSLCHDKERRTMLAHRLHDFARPHAARDLAQLIVSAIKK